MATQIHGRITEHYSNGVAMQADRSIVEKNDGTLEGGIRFECDRAHIANLPGMGAAHADDSRLELYNRSITYHRMGKVSMEASYFGLVSSKTDPILSYTPNTDREAITTHERFVEFAGTKDNPKNGARFDPETGEFLGFFDPSIEDLFAADFYFTPSTSVSLSYWQRNAPSLSRRMSIRASVPGFRKPPDVKDFLLLDMPYRQVGSFYQVTELFLGSGPKGWSKTIYG